MALQTINSVSSSSSGNFTVKLSDRPRSLSYATTLDDRDFEKLLFSIFNRHIDAQQQPYCKIYDTAHLMPIGADGGQDVILTKEGRRVGLIQCKRYQGTLSDSECAKEIIKFALNAICDPSLITDRDEYRYFLAITSQFSVTATSLLASFNTRILQEPKLEVWTNQVIKSYSASFGHLTYHEKKADLIDILTRIKVQTIIPTQLDEWLYQPAYVPIVKQFFPDVLLVVPADMGQPTRTNTQLIEELFDASVDLASWSTPFEQSGFLHLERAETSQLIQWIQNPLSLAEEKSNIPNSAIFLIGGAGSGKTTMLRDLLLTLHRQQIPVLGLKADRLVLTQRGDLEPALGLSGKLDELIRQLAKEYPRVVVLIDQLDALSQSLSANRHGILTYNRLIEQLARLPNTRLVISCRRYDFDYDPVLVQFRNRTRVEVNSLSDEQVEQVLQKLALIKSQITTKLFELLHVPLHLTLFCQVHRDVADLATLATLQDLYHALWTQKVLYIPDAATVTVDQVRSLVQAMAAKMYEQQRISLPLRLYESQYRTAIDYLSSQSLITQYDNKLQFFHQSFFDYVFARSFVERGNSLTDDILSVAKHQGLFIRSQIRQVLAYLRETDEGYEKEIRTLLTSTGVRFHIQLLTIQHLASQADPLPSEYRLLQLVIQPNSLLWETFLEAVNTANWFRFITQDLDESFDLADPVAYNRLYQLCRRIQYWCPSDLIQFLHQLPPSAERGQFIGNVLFVLDDFTSPLALELFEEAYALRPNDDMWFYHVMEHAIASQPDWVGEQIKRRLLQLISPIEVGYHVKLPGDRHDHQLIDCLEKLHEKLPQKAFAVGLAIIEALLAKAKPYDWEDRPTNLIVDTTYHHYIAREASHDTHFGLLAKLETWLCTWLDSNPTEATQQLTRLMEKEYVTLIALGLHGVTHQPVLLADMVFGKLSESRWIEEHCFVSHEYFERAVRGALRASFFHWTSAQQQHIADRILVFNPTSEYHYYRSQNNQLFGATGIRQYDLINLLPPGFIESYTPIKKRYQELRRKFPDHKTDDSPRRGMVTWGGRSMSSGAYAQMKDKHWLRSFIRYNHRSNPKWNGVDELTHAQRFEQEVKQRPDRFISLLEAIIAQPDIPDLYLFYGLDGLAESSCDLDTFKRLFLSSLTRSPEEQYITRLIRLTDYWVKRKTFDSEAFDFLEYCAQYGTEETRVYNEMDLLNRGINTVRGAAIYRMYQWVHEVPYTERCFQIVSQVGINGSVAVRAVSLTDQAQFNHYDPKRSLDLFLMICEGYEVDLASVAWHSLQHGIHVDFQAVVPYLVACLGAAPEQLHVMAQLAMIGYKYGYQGSEELLERYLEKGVEAINGAIDIALSCLTDKNKGRRDRCVAITFRFLTHTDKEVSQAYLSAFLKFKITEFKLLLPFLEAYAQSNVGKIRDHEFYAYLMKCVKKQPNDCIRLGAYFDQHLGPDMTHRHLRNEPVDLILQAYNCLEELQAPTGEKERAMDVFDKMLKNPHYRVQLNGVTTALN
jgi:hypothetical protein